MTESLQGDQTPQSVYARNLISHRGYPLWIPELKTQLPEEYQEHGLKIGDVGYVVPGRGCFEVLFNICLSLDHDLHRDKQLPRNFHPITLTEADIATYLGEEATGKVIKSTSVTTIEISPEGQPSDYKFTFPSSEGALLILPHGADQHSLQRDRLFGKYAKQHAVEWYRFVDEDLERTISDDSLYLITGFYKARSWALAAFGESKGSANIPAQFKVTQSEGAAVVRGYNWVTTRHSESRVGPENYNGKANQAVYISGFKIAVRDRPIARKEIRVKADHPSLEPCYDEFSDTVDSPPLNEPGCNESSGSTHSSHGSSATLASIQHAPKLSQPFHPANIINRYLLRKVPSATIAITHDSQWTALLKSTKGELEPHDLADEQLVIQAVSDKYVVVLEDGVVSLQSTKGSNHTPDIGGCTEEKRAPYQANDTISINDSEVWSEVYSEVYSDSSDEELITPPKSPMHHASPVRESVFRVPIHGTDLSEYNYTHTLASSHGTANLSASLTDSKLTPTMSDATTLMAGSDALEVLAETSTGATIGCQWSDARDIGICNHPFTRGSLARHLADKHGIMAIEFAMVECKWAFCCKWIRRKNLIRHIYETHLGYRRGKTGPSQQSEDTIEHPFM